MFKRLLLAVIIVTCGVSVAASQTVMLEPHGISPAQVKADTVGNPDYVGLFDHPYSGLLNVGVETKMYLKGSSGASLVAPTWTVLQQPAGSAAAVGVPVDVDTSTQVAVFTPDVVGTYIVEFADGGAAASVTINAAKYLGIEDGGCKFCHKAQTDDWMMTDHASMLQRALDAVPGGRSGATCLECHTTGYDENAMNDGFDDFDFVYPDSVFMGQNANMIAQYPDAMERANIQCEACHGPASEHTGVVSANQMVSSLATSACAVCHDDDHYHVYPSQFKTAGHANLPSYPAGNRTNCQGCHNGAQFIQFVEGEAITRQPAVDITCAVCHDPHMSWDSDPATDDGRYQLRTVEATLANGQKVMDAGNGGICMNCHQSRQDADPYTEEPDDHFGPHYAPQADMLLGTNAVTFGKTLPTSPHFAGLEHACVDCHMYELGAHGEHNVDGDLNTAGMHSFSMVSVDSVDNVAACEDCHGDVGETFHEKKFYMNGMADHDGDGVDEGLQEEVHGLIDKLGAMLPDSDPHADVDSTWTKTELKAAFNHRLVYYDHSYGIHNPAFIVSLLKVSMQALANNALAGDIVAIEDIPNDQGKQVWIIWDKMADDGVAVDPIASYTVKRDDGVVWTGVGTHVADGSARYALVVPTLYDSTDMDMGMTSFKVVAVTRGGMVYESMPAEGYSVDNLIPQAPVNPVALIQSNSVNLTWEEAGDPDINYYKIYRSTEAVFDANENTLVGTTASLEFVDANIEVGNYYYVIQGVDFSGNEGDLSPTVSAMMVSIDDGSLMPNAYSLSQNYPNPFNPVTKIDFSLRDAGRVNMVVYNTLGQVVTTLLNREMAAGQYSVSFSGSNLPSGEYFYRIEVTNNDGVQYKSMNKMILMK